ncbi:uncharacterized protein LOC130891091 isoform X2 [Diorhabda carinulata]|uniref:uncharacterized protein LOC130891091 isoform X2 n=1 Tax=Diorhabda carinulata TaxID=1163345 RepID=UPI0025A25223|nr:uncharacterized protein LOC130891091 isoform X2 [Diorhabda carinulata]XP_057651616.1 uncharacterized protein LOC130891091 isoform X2 [Diorhabda carinulata]XP_057651617.1 uncharacterized protein LOC130891091 isoform X2 [Diorhabda carinulata]XP_057651618.1 uncharacterized protein LOC130891091 isoform X2 [Diorhabda carinulata]
MFYKMRRPRGVQHFPFHLVTDNFRRNVVFKGKGMTEVGVIRGSPDSDCNSNHHGSSSYLSNTSSQDIDFIQDNSDYQWFIDYGYRDGGTNNHTSILSLPESYEAGDLNYYDAFSKNMDANLAEADMESFRTEDIHALLTNLPPMCTDHLSQENNRQGECYASVSGSMMAKFDLESSISPHSSSQGDECSANSNSMSICKSELLFSPVKETPVPVNFSVDSLDCDLHDMMLTCQANKDNYTIAFEGSVTMYSEDSDYIDKDKSENSHHSDSSVWPSNVKNNIKVIDGAMTRSDSNSFTTWSKLKKLGSENILRKHPSGNNNNSTSETSHLGLTDTAAKSQSMPDLYKRKLKNMAAVSVQSKNSSTDSCTIKKRPVKLFDIQHQSNGNGSGSISEMATSVDVSFSDNANNKQPNFSLVKLFMKQKSMSAEGMSTTMDQLSSSENWPVSQSGGSCYSESKDNLKINARDVSKTSNCEIMNELAESLSKLDLGNEETNKNINNNNNDNEKMNRSIQTSQFSEITNLKQANKLKSSENTTKRFIKIIEPSFLTKLKKEGQVEKPVYVLYPDYVLPNLDFLNDKTISPELRLLPQKPTVATNKRRPFSCNDLESLKKKGFAHVQDWDSLNVLLPYEYRKILSEIPEVSQHIKKPSFVQNKFPKRRPLSCEIINQSSSSSTTTQPSSGYRGSSSLLTDSQNSPVPNTNPLFVYRYDSVTSSEASLLNSEKQRSITTTAQIRTQEECLPPRPPLPRGILRKGIEKIEANKRYSMYETSEEETNEDPTYKRKSLPEPYYLIRNKRFSETEDEGVDAGTSSSSLDEHPDSLPHTDVSNMSIDELAQLEEFLKLSGISATDQEELTEKNLGQLRSYVSKFLTLKINQENGEHFGGKKCVSFAEKVNVLPKYLESKQFIPPNNSPNVSAFIQQKNYQTKKLSEQPICEENENSPNYSSPQTTPIHLNKTLSDNLIQKRSLISAVTDAVEQIMHHFSLASNQMELNALGDSSTNPACAKLCLTTLCPALYAVLSDGLKPNLETSFGAIHNSVWQVVEASAQQGPLTKALHDLVMRINSEDAITEGLVKFNAFVFGLLNVRSLDAWTSFLRTRESVLKKHYTADSLLVMSHTGGANVRSLLDTMVTALQPLAFLPFQFDLLFEFKQLHQSFKRMDSYNQSFSPTHKHSPSPNFKQFNSTKMDVSRSRSNSESEEVLTVKNYSPLESQLPDVINTSPVSKSKLRLERPRSCVESSGTAHPNFKLGENINDIAKKRWSGIALTSKLYQAFDKLAKEDEEYIDSLENTKIDKNDEPESLDSNFSDEKPINGKRFKKLQQKWEKLSGHNPLESPPSSPTHAVKSKIPRPITSPIKPSGIPIPVTNAKIGKKMTAQPKNVANNIKNSPAKRNNAPNTRTSRVDQLDNPHDIVRHPQRPSSLPYSKPTQQNGKTTKITPPRRAASSSLSRRPVTQTNVPKIVKTVSHRLPSESGHLSYNEGEKLRVVLEVDEKWLLCCRGTQKGLVPRSAVIADKGRF